MPGSVARRRWLVHLGLLLTVTVSLVFEFVLTAHVVVGLVFVGFVVAHLAQRRRTSSALVRAPAAQNPFNRRIGRLAWSDLLLSVSTAAMLASGFVDLALGHPTKIRWHALLGVSLTICLVLHTWRRRRRLRRSSVHSFVPARSPTNSGGSVRDTGYTVLVVRSALADVGVSSETTFPDFLLRSGALSRAARKDHAWLLSPPQTVRISSPKLAKISKRSPK